MKSPKIFSDCDLHFKEIRHQKPENLMEANISRNIIDIPYTRNQSQFTYYREFKGGLT